MFFNYMSIETYLVVLILADKFQVPNNPEAFSKALHFVTLKTIFM